MVEITREHREGRLTLVRKSFLEELALEWGLKMWRALTGVAQCLECHPTN